MDRKTGQRSNCDNHNVYIKNIRTQNFSHYSCFQQNIGIQRNTESTAKKFTVLLEVWRLRIKNEKSLEAVRERDRQYR